MYGITKFMVRTSDTCATRHPSASAETDKRWTSALIRVTHPSLFPILTSTLYEHTGLTDISATDEHQHRHKPQMSHHPYKRQNLTINFEYAYQLQYYCVFRKIYTFQMLQLCRTLILRAKLQIYSLISNTSREFFSEASHF